MTATAYSKGHEIEINGHVVNDYLVDSKSPTPNYEVLSKSETTTKLIIRPKNSGHEYTLEIYNNSESLNMILNEDPYGENNFAITSLPCCDQEQRTNI